MSRNGYSRLLATIAYILQNAFTFFCMHLVTSFHGDSFVHKTSGDRNAEGIYKYGCSVASWTFAFSEGRRIGCFSRRWKRRCRFRLISRLIPDSHVQGHPRQLFLSYSSHFLLFCNIAFAQIVIHDAITNRFEEMISFE